MKTLEELKQEATYDGKLDQEAYSELVQWYCYHEAKKEYDKLVNSIRQNWIAVEHFKTADFLIASARDNAWDVDAWHELELTINNEPSGIFDDYDPKHYDRTATYLIRTIGSIIGLCEDYSIQLDEKEI